MKFAIISLFLWSSTSLGHSWFMVSNFLAAVASILEHFSVLMLQQFLLHISFFKLLTSFFKTVRKFFILIIDCNWIFDWRNILFKNNVYKSKTVFICIEDTMIWLATTITCNKTYTISYMVNQCILDKIHHAQSIKQNAVNPSNQVKIKTLQCF